MQNKEFNEVIDFAIGREKEAVAFYQDLQNLVSFEARKDLLHELEEMEKGHIAVLEKIRTNAVQMDISDIPKVDNLKISDYLVEVKPTADMSYQDIIIAAMKREEKSNQLYIDLANLSAEGETKQLFLRIAAEEAKHKLHFEKIYDEEILTDN